MAPIRDCLNILEKLSLLSSKNIVNLLERSVCNVEPILRVDTKGKDPMLWQNELDLDRLHKDEARPQKISPLSNAPNIMEDYVVVGRPKNKGPSKVDKYRNAT